MANEVRVGSVVEEIIHDTAVTGSTPRVGSVIVETIHDTTTTGSTPKVGSVVVEVIHQPTVPLVRDIEFTSISATTSWAAAGPATVEEGDLLVAYLAFAEDQSTATGSSTGSLTGPSGWTEDYQTVGKTSSGDTVGFLWWKYATAADESGAPVTYTWTANASTNGAVIIMRITGMDTTVPIHRATYATTGASASTMTYGSMTTEVDNCLLVAFGCVDRDSDDAPFWADPMVSGWTPVYGSARVDNAYGASFVGPGVARSAKYTAGSLGTVSATSASASDALAGLLIAIPPPYTPATPADPVVESVRHTALTSSSIAVRGPLSVSTGDLMLCIIASSSTQSGVTGSSTGSLTAPSGWSEIQAGVNRDGGSDSSLHMWYKVAEAGDQSGAPTTYTWTATGSSSVSALMYVITGADTSTPIAASGVASNTGTTVTVTGIATGGTNRLVLAVAECDRPFESGPLWTDPVATSTDGTWDALWGSASAWRSWYGDSAMSIGVAELRFPTETTLANVTLTSSSSDDLSAALIAIAPSDPNATVTPAAIATTVAMPAATTVTGATATPAAIAATVAMPAASALTGTPATPTPATIATTVAVPAAAVVVPGASMATIQHRDTGHTVQVDGTGHSIEVVDNTHTARAQENRLP